MPGKFTKVRIRTPARLHFTLIDLNGDLGRIDGGIGLAIDKPNWIVEISKDTKWSAPELISGLLEKLQQELDVKGCYRFEFGSRLPAHVGLGSQTQLSLAVAHGLSLLEGRERSIYELASIVGRGGTSGIGVAAYANGGFILDGGHSISEKPEFSPSHFSTAKPAIQVLSLKVPETWHFVVAIPDVGQGKHGHAEVEIFNKYCPIPASEVEKVTRIILMKILPAILENDVEVFGEGLQNIQSLGFKGVENQLANESVKGLQDFFLAHGATGSGLSSFGPATYCIVETETAAVKLVEETKIHLEQNGITGTVFDTRANNNGAEVKKS